MKVAYDDPVERVVRLQSDGTWSFVRRTPGMRVSEINIEAPLPNTDGSGLDVYGRPIT